MRARRATEAALLAEGRARLIEAAAWLVCLTPLPVVFWRGLTGSVMAQFDMVAALGLWALRLLVAGLAITPASRLLGWRWLTPLRRPVGLCAFVYAAAHLAAYLVVAGAWRWPVRAVAERPDFIPALMALAVLAAAAAASLPRLRDRLGPMGWKRVQALVQVAAPLAVLHAVWPTGLGDPGLLAYVVAVVALLALRLAHRRPGG